MVAIGEMFGEVAAEVWLTVRGIGPATAGEVHGDMSQRMRLGVLAFVSGETLPRSAVEQALVELAEHQAVEQVEHGRWNARPLAAIAWGGNDGEQGQLRLFV